MGRKLSLEIIETAEELKELLRKQREGRLKERVQALYLQVQPQVVEHRVAAEHFAPQRALGLVQSERLATHECALELRQQRLARLH
jgi:hypothetical protein